MNSIVCMMKKLKIIKRKMMKQKNNYVDGYMFCINLFELIYFILQYN